MFEQLQLLVCQANEATLMIKLHVLQGLESLVEFATERFGSEAVIAIDSAMPPRARYSRMQRFCAPER